MAAEWKSAWMNIVTQGTFALGRLMSVLLATKFSPAFMLLCNIVRSTVTLCMTYIVYNSIAGMPLITSPAVGGAKYCDERVCMSVCLFMSVCSHISKITRPNFTKVSVRVTQTVARSSSDDSAILGTSGFVDDVMFSHKRFCDLWGWQCLRERRAMEQVVIHF